MARLFKVCWAAPLAFFSFSLYPASSTSSFRIFSSNAVVRSSSLWLASPNDGAGALAFLAPKMRRILFLVCWSFVASLESMRVALLRTSGVAASRQVLRDF